MGKNKIKQYFKLEREITKLDEAKWKLDHQQSDIFLSKLKKNNALYINSTSVFEVFLKNIHQSFDRYDIIRVAEMYWSTETLQKQLTKILKVLLEEKFIVKDGRFYYTVNPEFMETIKRNKKT